VLGGQLIPGFAASVEQIVVVVIGAIAQVVTSKIGPQERLSASASLAPLLLSLPRSKLDFCHFLKGQAA